MVEVFEKKTAMTPVVASTNNQRVVSFRRNEIYNNRRVVNASDMYGFISCA